MYAPRPSLRLTKDFPDKWIFDTTLNSPALRRNRTDHWPSLMCLDHPSSQLPLGGWLDSEACKISRCHLVKQNGCQFVGFCWAQTSVSPSSKTEALRASRLKTDGYCWIQLVGVLCFQQPTLRAESPDVAVNAQAGKKLAQAHPRPPCTLSQKHSVSQQLQSHLLNNTSDNICKARASFWSTKSHCYRNFFSTLFLE